MCAEQNIQLHGGIGFTWEHDAHLYLKRAVALAAVFGPARRHRRSTWRALTDAGVVGRARGRAPTRGRDVPRRGARVHRAVPRALPRPSSSARFLDSGLRARALADAVGPRRRRGRAARDRGGAARRRRAPAAVRDRRLGHPDAHAARRRRPDRTLDPPEPRARVHVVPAVLRAGRRLRRRRRAHPGHQGRRRVAGHRPEGVDHRRARSATAGSPPCAPIPTSPSTTASP